MAKSSWLLIGPTGSGKTTQFRTFPGKKFVYLFDPNAESSLKGIEYDKAEFFPEMGELDFMPRSIRKSGSIKRQGQRPKTVPHQYIDWCNDINERWERGFFKQYDSVLLDSLTTFGKALMDATQHLQEDAGSEDMRTDYQLAGTRMTNALRQFMSLPCHILICAHNELMQDDLTGRLFRRILMPGSARAQVPLLCENVLITSVEIDRGTKQASYLAQTKPDRENPVCRTAIRNLDFQHDITIPADKWRNPQGCGIGGLIEKES
ncbi:MAG: AAA family ATPase [Geminicoccaceae bacterium]